MTEPLCFDCGQKIRPSDLGRVTYLELFEMFTAANRATRVAEAVIRDRWPDDVHIVLAQQERIRVLEANVERLISERSQQAA